MALPLLVLGSCGKVDEPAPGAGTNPAPKATYGAAGGPQGRAPGSKRELSAEEMFAKGQQVSMDGDSKRAIRLYTKALAKDPSLTEARFALGTALVPTASASALGSGSKDPAILAKSIEHLRQAVSEEPENADYTYWLGRVLDVAGQEEEAATVLAHATELDPEHGKAWKRLGLVQNDLGNRDEALAAWLRAAELLPKDGGVFFNLGNHFFEEDLERSSDYYRQATVAEPTFSKGYLGLSKTLAQLGKNDEAEQAKQLFEAYEGHAKRLRKLVYLASESPEDEDAQFAAAELYFALGQDEPSLAMFRRVLHLDPKNAFAHFYIGQIFTRDGDPESALNHFEECVFLEPGVADSLLALLATTVALKNELRSEEVIETLEPLLETPEQHATLADLLDDLGQTERAQAQRALASPTGE